MLQKLKIFAIIVIFCITGLGLFKLSSAVDNVLENRPPNSNNCEQSTEVTTLGMMGGEELTSKIDLAINEESPEIDNSDYGWLQHRIRRCHPTMKEEVKIAFENDGVIREDEYRAIMNRCLEYIEQQAVGEKDELRRFLQQ